MPVLSARGVSKAYGARSLFEGASLTLVRGQRVGLMGDNGAGKSTLMRVLAGLEPLDEGTLERRRGARIMFLDQRPELAPEKTPRAIIREGLSAWVAAKAAYDAVVAQLERTPHDAALLTEQGALAESLQSLGGWDVDHLIEDVAHRLGVMELDREVRAMSGGEKRRIALAQILVARPDLAILDEPTNHLDTETITWLEEYLTTSFPGAVLVVTHDRYFLDAVCQRILELDRGVLREYEGNYSDFLVQKAEQAEHEARVEQNRQNLLRREQAWLRRGAKARSTKQKARIGRALELLAIEAPAEREHVSFAEVGPRSARLGKTILDFDDVSLSIGERELVKNLSMRLVAGDRIGIVGKNGAGKTSLLRGVLGELSPKKGAITVGLNTQIALIDQARASLEEGWSVFDNVAGFSGAERAGGGNALLAGKTVTLRSYLEHFGFDSHAQRRLLSSLSGGERARVAIAKILKEGPNLLLLDEPTNDLDTTTLAALEDMLESWPGCALVVSHDRAFLDSVATGILAFEGDGRVIPYPGNYETYLRLRPDARGVSAPPPSEKEKVVAPTPSATPPPDPTLKPLTWAERKELDGIMDAIAAAETAVTGASARLSDPALYSASGPEQARARAEHDSAEEKLATLLARWEQLEARKDIKK